MGRRPKPLVDGKKICVGCGQPKALDAFRSNGRSSKRSRCSECMNAMWWYRVQSSVSSRIGKFKKGEITIQFLLELAEKQKGRCFWLGVPMDFTMQCPLAAPSLDRIDNSRGYYKDNVVLSTRFANTGRRDATTEQFEDFIRKHLIINKK